MAARYQLDHAVVRVLPALEDNYMYLLVDAATSEAAIVDPVQPDDVLAAVKEEGVKLTTVLTTHHHWDHAGGNEELVKKVPGLTVFGGDDRIGALTREVKHEEEFKLGQLSVKALSTPCHTSGHICYYVHSSDLKTKLVFTGDTLFVANCGKFFEGTAEQMYNALCKVLSSLPEDTEVFCGHEYTVKSLSFALAVEPHNKNTQDKLEWAEQQRKEQRPTVPSTIGQELSYNPFMRVGVPSVQAFTGTSDPIATMASLRNAKDNFKAKV